MHVARESKSSHHDHCANRVEDVVHVEAITRTLLLSNAGECAIQTVAKPVHDQTDDCSQQHAAIPDGQGVTNAGCDLGYKGENCQMIGVDIGRHALGHPNEAAFFAGGKKAGVNTGRIWMAAPMPPYVNSDHLTILA